MTELSPQAQAVLDAAKSSLDWEAGYLPNAVAAAALRVAACQLREAYANETCVEPADDLLDSVATELENA